MIGKAGHSATATLVERASRYRVPVAPPAGKRDAVTTCDAPIALITGMPSVVHSYGVQLWIFGFHSSNYAVRHRVFTADSYGSNKIPKTSLGTRKREARVLETTFY